MAVRKRLIGAFVVWTIILIIYLQLQPEKVELQPTSGQTEATTKTLTLDGFLEMDNARFFGYSSFYDNRKSEPIIMVIGLAMTKQFNNPICTFRDRNGKTSISLTDAIISHLNHGKIYEVTFIACPLPYALKKSGTLPLEVSIRTFDTTASNFMTILFPTYQQMKYRMGMCIQPFLDFEDPFGIIEWIEFHKLLGVDHFTFYNHSLGPESSIVLESYGKEVLVLPWHLPFNPVLITNAGQTAQINDCIYRYMNLTEYVGSVDVDEYIVPGKDYLQNFTNYGQLFESVAKAKGNKSGNGAASIQFPSAFSYSHFPRYNSHFLGDAKLKERLKILSRQAFSPSWRYVFKHKIILKPRLTIESEVHWLTKTLNNSENIIVNENQIHFFHFRECTAHYLKMWCLKRLNCTTCHGMHFKKDSSIAEKFGEPLLLKVTEKVKSLNALLPNL